MNEKSHVLASLLISALIIVNRPTILQQSPQDHKDLEATNNY